MSMLTASDLSCVRGDRTLFSALSLSAGAGTLVRVSGENGSGKTSLLRILCGLLLPTSGEVRWDNVELRTLREEFWKELVYVGHLNALKDDLTATENLEIASTLSGRPTTRAAALNALDFFGVAHCSSLPARALSQGQRRRAALARLQLSGASPLWVLDEPLTALDVAGIDRMESLISEHVARGGIVVLTTHQDVHVGAPHVARIELGG